MKNTLLAVLSSLLLLLTGCTEDVRREEKPPVLSKSDPIAVFSAASDVIEVDDTNFAKEVLEYDGVILVDFYATWCGPCRKMSPIIDDLSVEFKGKIKFCRLDVDKAPLAARKYHVDSLPSLIFFKGGKPISISSGLVSKESIKKYIENKFFKK